MDFYMVDPNKVLKDRIRAVELKMVEAMLHDSDVSQLEAYRNQLVSRLEADEPKSAQDTSVVVELAKEVAGYRPEDFDSYAGYVNAVESRIVDLSQVIDDVPTMEVVPGDLASQIWPEPEKVTLTQKVVSWFGGDS